MDRNNSSTMLHEKRHRDKRITILILFILLVWPTLRVYPEANRFAIEHFRLNVEIIPEKHWLWGEAAIRIRSSVSGLRSFGFYIRPTLRVSSARDDENHTLSFSQTTVKRIFPNSDTSLVRITMSRHLEKGEEAGIIIRYGGVFYMSSAFNPEERRYNRAFSSITREACWLRSVQLWYPYIPEKSMPLTIKVKIPSGWTAITNGDLREISTEQNKRGYIFEEDRTTSLDIFLFAASYVSKTKDAGGFRLTAYFFPQHKDLLEAYLERTAEILGFYTTKFGRPKAEKFSIIEIGSGYGTGTSAPFGYAISSHLVNTNFPLIPHEIAHLWWGETVSDNLGKDTWLHEGLATFSDYCYRLEKASDRDAQRRILFSLLNRAIPIGNPKTLSILEAGEKHAPEGFLVYERAASMLFTLKHLLGEELFFKALRQYLETFRGKKADTDGFIRVFQSVSGKDLSWFFDFYLKGERPPHYRVRFRNLDNQVVGTLYQDHAPKNFRMSVPLEFATNQRIFQKNIEVRGHKKRFIYRLAEGEAVQRITADPDFEILAVREALEDRWKARSLRLEAAREKNFRRIEPRLFALWEKQPDNIPIMHEVAQFYFAQKKWKEGIALYQKVLDLDSNDFAFLALANIAGAYETIGDKKMQKLYLEKALARGSSMYSITRSLMDKLKKLEEKEKTSGDSLDENKGHIIHLVGPGCE